MNINTVRQLTKGTRHPNSAGRPAFEAPVHMQRRRALKSATQFRRNAESLEPSCVDTNNLLHLSIIIGPS